MALWLKNTVGQKSASLTFVTAGFVVVTLWLAVSIVAKIGNFEIREFDGSEAMAYLTPLLALYFGRRWTDVKGSIDSGTSGANVDTAPSGSVAPPAGSSVPPTE